MWTMRDIFRLAEEIYEATRLKGDSGTYFPGTTPAE
jgi:hypothetical protein